MATIITKGVDVSKYQGNVDFTKVKAVGISYVIINAGYGDALSYPKQKDPYFEQNYKNAKAVGLDVGVYWYSYATSEAAAKREAESCKSVLEGKKLEYPVYFDLEEQSQFAKGKAFCDSIVKAFCGELEKSGYFAGLYISRSPLQTYISDSVAKKYALWVAEYGSKCNYGGAYGMWQYSSTGKVSGISGNVDMDYCYVDYPTLIKNGGYNGYPKPAAVVKELDSIGFKKGDKGVGVLALKKLLLLAGKQNLVQVSVDDTGGFGGGTENAVNALLKSWGYKPNGVAGEKFIAKLYENIK